MKTGQFQDEADLNEAKSTNMPCQAFFLTWYSQLMLP